MKLLKNYLIDAILLLVLGVILLVRPNETELLLIRLFGLLALILGAIKIIGFLTEKEKEDRNVPRFLLGILEVVCGIALLATPNVFLAAVPIIAGIVIVLGALLSLAQAVRLLRSGEQKPLATPAFILAIVTLVLGVIVLLHPTVVANVIVRLIGLAMLVEGAALLLSNGGRKKK